MKSFFQHDLEIDFHPWVTKFVHFQFLRLGTFPLGRRLEGKGDFAAYQPMISVAISIWHHSGAWYVSRVMLPSQDVVQKVPVFGAWVSLCCLEPILLLEQCVGDDELMLKAELQKQVHVVNAVANSVCLYQPPE